MKDKMSKKGAMELSVNTIVIVVIGITLLVLGLVFVRDIFDKLSGLGSGAFEEAEKELSQIQTGDAKINFPTAISVKKGKSKTTTLKICNTDGTYKVYAPSNKDAKIVITPSGFFEGLTVTIKGKTVDYNTVSETIGGTAAPPAQQLPGIKDKTCLPVPVLIYAKPTTTVNLAQQPYFVIDIKDEDDVSYDKIGVTISVE